MNNIIKIIIIILYVRLERIASPQGRDEYVESIERSRVTIIDLLKRYNIKYNINIHIDLH